MINRLEFRTITTFFLLAVVMSGCTLFEDKYVAKGHKLFNRYCTPCHGPDGSGNGYNAINLESAPRDLTDASEEYMAKLDNNEIYEVLELGGYGVDLAPTMPVWGKIFSEEELWSLVAFIRTLHPNDAEPIVFTKPGSEEPVFETKRVRYPKVRPKAFYDLYEELVPDEDAYAEQVGIGSEVFEEHGCNACHVIDGEGGTLGPDLSRAGFMLQPQFMFRWVLNPQAFLPKTRMPNLDLTPEDALAVTLYLSEQKGEAPGGAAVTKPVSNDEGDEAGTSDEEGMEE